MIGEKIWQLLEKEYFNLDFLHGMIDPECDHGLKKAIFYFLDSS